MADAEDWISLDRFQYTLANDLTSLSSTISTHLKEAFVLTQLQLSVIDQALQQAMADYSRDLQLRIKSGVSSSDLNTSLGLPAAADRSVDEQGDTSQNPLGSLTACPPSTLQSYLPRSMFVPALSHHPAATGHDIQIGPPQIPQLDPTFHIERQHMADFGDLYLGLSIDPNMTSLENSQSHQWPEVPAALPETYSDADLYWEHFRAGCGHNPSIS